MSRQEPPAAIGVQLAGGEKLALWGCTLTLYLALLWLYWPSLRFAPLALQDQERLAALSSLPLTSALGHVAHGPLRPGENLLLWLIAHSAALMPWRAGLLGTFLLTTGFLQYYASERAGGWLAGIAAAACFGLNPTTSSVVCWLSRAHIVLCALAVLSYVKCGQIVLDRAPGRGARLGWALAALLGLGVALSLYELAVFTPLLLVLYQWLLAPRGAGRAARGLYAGSLALVIAYVCLQLTAANAWRWWDGESGWALLANGTRYAMHNLLLWVWPWGSFGVSIPDVAGDHSVENVVCWVALLGFLAALWQMRKHDPNSVYGFVWSLVFVLPVGTVLHFEGEPVAAHHLLLPMLGFTFAGARVTLWLLEKLSTSIRPRPVRLLVDAVVSILFFWTFAPLVAEAQRAVELWGDEEQLYLDTLQNYPASAVILDRLTQRYLAQTLRTPEPQPEAGAWESLWSALLMRPEREPPASLIRRGRELVGRARYVEGASACALALETPASAEEHQEAARTLVRALRQTDQAASAAALEERLSRAERQVD